MTTRKLTLTQAAELMERHGKNFIRAVEKHFVEGAAKTIWPEILKVPIDTGLYLHLQKPSINKAKFKRWPKDQLRPSGEPKYGERGKFPRPADNDAEQLVKSRKFGRPFYVTNSRRSAAAIEDLREPHAYEETWYRLIGNLSGIGDSAIKKASEEI